MLSSLFVSSLTGCSSICEFVVNLLFWEGKYCHLYCQWLLCCFPVVEFQIEVYWSH